MRIRRNGEDAGGIDFIFSRIITVAPAIENKEGGQRNNENNREKGQEKSFGHLKIVMSIRTIVIITREG